MEKLSYKKLEKRVRELEKESLKNEVIQEKNLERQRLLREQNVNIVKKSQNDLEKTMDALRKSEKRFREMANLLPTVICEMDINYKITYVNESAYKTFGYSRADVEAGLNAMNIIHPDDKQKAIDNGIKIFKGEKISGQEYRMFAKNGEELTILIQSSPLYVDGKPAGLRSSMTDVTELKKAEEERKKLEEQLIQSQKMESIGRLAGGIAHDFNNILAVILGYADLMKIKYSDETSEVGYAVRQIISNAKRAKGLTVQLLGFARGGKYNPIPLSMNTMIMEAINILEKMFENNIAVKYDFENNIAACEADKNQIDQVLANIIINAKDAMPDGGEIFIKTENVYFDKESVLKTPEVEPGDYVKISIADTGIGIPEKIIDKIFEPFFSTKEAGKGTGLGLATVYGIIKNHHGHFEVKSKPGEGTIFTFYLPASGKTVFEEEIEGGIIEGDELILVVDDNESVREVVQAQLEYLGYRVLLGCDGIEATKVFKKQSKEIKLVLLDMIMPNMAGRETYFALKDINPEVKILLMSGFSQNEKAMEILNDGAIGYLQKPIEFKKLSRAIAEAINK